MKMHGLKDEPYWMISYSYFFALSAVYMIVFVVFGSLIGNQLEISSIHCIFANKFIMLTKLTFFLTGLNFFKTNNYGIQFVFYFIYINLQIALAFFVAAFFSSVKTATGLWFKCSTSKEDSWMTNLRNFCAAVVGYIYVFGSGLLGAFLLRFFVESTSFPSRFLFYLL